MTHHHTFLRRAAAMVSALCLWAAAAVAQTGIWATAYYAGWSQGYNNTGSLPAQNIDYSAVTHIIHFSLVPNSNGTLDDQSNSVTAFNANALVTAAHAAGKKVLICVGGWGSDAAFRSATSSSTVSTFVANLVSLMKSRGYDGIDVDWETLASTDAAQYSNFITLLRSALDAVTPRPLLTAATAWQPSIFVPLAAKFDQINIMTYDMSGAWSGWVTWPNSPVYDGGFRFPSTGGAPPSTDGMVNSFTSAGVPVSKLGVGIDFYGYVWSGGDGTPTGGATAPRQSWTTAPTVQSNVPYYTIMSTYYQSGLVKWDAPTQSAYLSIDNSGSANDKYISYDNEQTVQAKVSYAKSKGVGGLIVWELGGGYRADQPAGQRDLLLQSLKNALGSTGTTTDVTPPTVAITSPASGATLAGTVTVAANATDNVGVTQLRFAVDGSLLGSVLTVAPFNVSLNTATLTDGSHTIVASASDAAGNTGSATVTVNVKNGTTTTTNDLWIFQESLASPWADNSWSLTATYGSPDQHYAGTMSIKAVETSAWGGLSIHDGTWGSGTSVNSSQYTSLEFYVYAPASGTSLTIFAENDAAQVFPQISYGTVPVNQWTVVSIPVSKLNPNNQAIQRISIQEVSGSTKTFYVDNFRFVGTSGTTIAPPVLAGPSNGITNVSTTPSVSWNASSGASSYHVQVAKDSSYGATVFDKSSVTATTQTVSGLGSGATYYWRVNASNATSTSAWSSSFRFTTAAGQQADTTKPVVAITAPAAGATVSGTVSVTANATDNVRVSGVQFELDGAPFGSEVTAAPYGAAWNTTSAANGAHVLSAVARDSAGNTSAATITVTVSNSGTTPNTDLYAFDDSLRSPWIDASWTATVTYGSTDQHYTGQKSIKVVQGAWGALRLHSGAWGSPVDVKAAGYTSLNFAIYGGTAGVSLGVYFENDNGSSFPSVSYVWIAANKWTSVSFPMSQLDPAGNPIDRLVIQDMTGRLKTFYVDDIHFVAVPTALAKDGTAPVTQTGAAAPSTFTLLQNYPNPFNPSTMIRYALPFDGAVRLEVFNVLGERVGTLVDRNETAGEYAVEFNASSLPSGAYFYRITLNPTGGSSQSPIVMTKRMLLTK